MSGTIQSAFRALLTDLDNTLYDFAVAQEYGCRAAVKNAGVGDYKDLMDALLFSLHGVESHEAIAEYFQKVGIADDRVILSAFREYEESKVSSVIPYSGVIETLEKIHQKGIMICAISNALSKNATIRLERMGITSFIDLLVTPDTCGHRKPDPGMYQYCAEKLGLSYNEICVVGDNIPNDIAPAKGLGMFTVHATYGDRLPKEFAGETIPDMVIMNFSEILDIIK